MVDKDLRDAVIEELRELTDDEDFIEASLDEMGLGYSDGEEEEK